MKITPEHYEFIKSAIQKNFPDVSLVNAHRTFIETEWKRENHKLEKENVEKRLRWDLLLLSVPSAWICANIYKYAADPHIDTALKQIVKELNFS
jgi:hypothetical protein